MICLSVHQLRKVYKKSHLWSRYDVAQWMSISPIWLLLRSSLGCARMNLNANKFSALVAIWSIISPR